MKINTGQPFFRRGRDGSLEGSTETRTWTPRTSSSSPSQASSPPSPASWARSRTLSGPGAAARDRRSLMAPGQGWKSYLNPEDFPLTFRLPPCSSASRPSPAGAPSGAALTRLPRGGREIASDGKRTKAEARRQGAEQEATIVGRRPWGSGSNGTETAFQPIGWRCRVVPDPRRPSNSRECSPNCSGPRASITRRQGLIRPAVTSDSHRIPRSSLM